MAVVAASVLVAVAAGCATGNADWRRESYDTTVELHVGDETLGTLRPAGDDRCSSPAPFRSFRACKLHDAAYELARRFRCEGLELPAHTSEQARLAADLSLAHQMALDGYPEWWVAVYYLAVRWGGWASWHEPCPAEDGAALHLPRGPPAGSSRGAVGERTPRPS